MLSLGGAVVDAGSGDFVVSVAVGAGVVDGVVVLSVFGVAVVPAGFGAAGFFCVPGVVGRLIPAEPELRVGSTTDALPAAVPLFAGLFVVGAGVIVPDALPEAGIAVSPVGAAAEPVAAEPVAGGVVAEPVSVGVVAEPVAGGVGRPIDGVVAALPEPAPEP